LIVIGQFLAAYDYIVEPI